MNNNRDVYKSGNILIEDNIIKAVGHFDESIVNENAETYNANGKILMPGLV